MIKKTPLRVIGVIAAIVLGWFLYRWFFTKIASPVPSLPPPQTASQATTPGSSRQGFDRTSETITLGTDSGSVAVKNFYRNMLETDGTGVLIAEADAYKIWYDTEASTFSVVVLGAPEAAVRSDAEKRFLTLLGISQDDACRLAVRVYGLPESEANGTKYWNPNLSFCPNIPSRQ